VSAGPADGSEARLRRPSDLRREMPAHRGRSAKDLPFLSWPPEFARAEPDRRALIVLLHLASLTAGRLLALAQDRPTAAGCLHAVLEGGAASEADGALAARIDGARVASALEAIGARLVAVGDPGYPDELLDLPDPPAGQIGRAHV